ncbi:MBL fold metallo-hydrolase [Enterococcus asini]|uniref:MBL fold metallo-hydrolase n=1 Tax=Enterococcus asini TaxID=57732 RepID=UPI000E4CE8D3|nr:MBL fold metallo-hydrolase [Enterococcus asini]RGW12390.1 MBL fold metallo-hydrolase [Enterococcus asini]
MTKQEVNYFTAEKITERVTRIRSAFEVCMYYVQGDTTGVLLDTGLGCGDLKGFVDSIAKTPYQVILSHGHCDHGGGSGQFEEVYLSPLDFELEKQHCTVERRAYEIHQAPVPLPDTWSLDQMIPQRQTPFLPLSEEMVFDLGGVTLEMTLVPGHTAGMMVFLLPEEKIAIYGDASGENTLICFPESTSLKEHLTALKKLKRYDGRYERILRNHGVFESDLILLDNNIQTCERILAGSDDRVPVHVHGVDGFAGKDRSKLHLESEKTGNIVYTLDKL